MYTYLIEDSLFPDKILKLPVSVDLSGLLKNAEYRYIARAKSNATV